MTLLFNYCEDCDLLLIKEAGPSKKIDYRSIEEG